MAAVRLARRTTRLRMLELYCNLIPRSEAIVYIMEIREWDFDIPISVIEAFYFRIWLKNLI